MASNQLVHACAGNPVPLSKVPGQVPQVLDFVEGALEQSDLTLPVLSIDGGRASSEPEATDLDLG